jgi:hypothetical protein
VKRLGETLTEIVWERDLPASPAVAWPYLVEPDKMSLWSRAPIACVDGGDGGAAHGVGALRSVTVHALGRETKFEEVVAESVAPSRFVYHVVRGLPLRDHEGIQTLESSGAGSRLVWRVRFEPIASPLGFGASRMLEGQMRTSLDALASVLGGLADEVDPGVSHAFEDDDAAVPSLLAQADRILGEQRTLADSLRDDPKYWFSRVYQYVTEEQIAFVRTRATHRAWVLRLLPVFHRFYVMNLEAHRAHEHVEAPWRVAFRSMDRAEDGPSVIRGLLLGVRTHIEEDLPRALAETWLQHYRARCDYVRLRADYLRMAYVFRVASSRLVAEMPPTWIPPHLRALIRFAPLELQDWAFSRSYYDVARARRKAFERGRGIASWIARATL